MSLFERAIKFNAVGAMGVLVQMAALAALRGGLHLHYLVATALAVEIAVLHNFVWHERWTWRDRQGPGVANRLLRFNLGNGLVSLVVNLGLMRLLVGQTPHAVFTSEPVGHSGRSPGQLRHQQLVGICGR